MRSASSLLGIVTAVSCAVTYGSERKSGQIGSYDLAVGQEFRFEVRSGTWLDGPDGKPEIPREDDGSPKRKQYTSRVYVTARNDDGSLHIVASTTSVADYPLVYEADLFLNGRVVYSPTSMPMLPEDMVQFIFPRLAANEDEWKSGWQELESRTGVRWRYEANDGNIHGSLEGPLDRVGLGTIKMTYHLNSTTRLPESVELNGYWRRYKETNYHLVRFKEVVERGEAWARQFQEDARRYFDFTSEQRRRLGRNNLVPLARASRVEGEMESLLDEARAAIVSARNGIKEPVFRDQLEHELKEFDEQRELRAKGAKRFAPIAGLPSPAWAAKDLDGREHRLEQYKGKVLVLDFWFRQCNYCIRAMPQVEQVADHFRAANAPVVFCGVNTDDDEADARFVVQELDLKYAVLWSKDISQTYGIRGYPTILVIDAEGVVQGILSGYSSTLREDLIACVAACR